MIVADDDNEIPNEDIAAPAPVELSRVRAKKNAASRVPPHDLAAEASLLGACMLKTTAIDAAERAGITGTDFYKPAHTNIWAAIIDLHRAGRQVDFLTLAHQLEVDGHLDASGGKQYLIELQAGVPAISNAPTYARIVDDYARQRTLIAHAADMAELGYQPSDDVAGVEARAAQILTFKPRPIESAYHDLDDFLDVDEPDHDWVVPGLLERCDRCIITAHAGTGKSTLLRQVGLMVAGGLHPFTLADINPVNVLLLDVENSARQVRREINPLRHTLGNRYQPGRFTVRVFEGPISIADPATLAELCRAAEQHQPGIILLGPLYKLLVGDPTDEAPARDAAAAFDKLRHVCGSALIIEAHSPYPNGKTQILRPYGASLWERWPEYGWHFDKTGRVEHWRGQREERAWPTGLERSTPWPWAARTKPVHDRAEADAWNGPTQCIGAVVDLLRKCETEELNGSEVHRRLRAINPNKGGFREKTVRDALEQAALDPTQPIVVRGGPNRSRLFTFRDLGVDVHEDIQEEIF